MSYKNLEIWQLARPFDDLHERLEILWKKLNRFLQALEKSKWQVTSNQ